MVPNQTNNNTSYNLGSLDAYRSRLEAIPSGKSLLLMRLFYPAEFHRILAARSKAYARTNPISQNNTQAQGTTPMRDNVAYLAGYMSKQAEITPNEDAPNTEGEDQSKKKDAKPEGDLKDAKQAANERVAAKTAEPPPAAKAADASLGAKSTKKPGDKIPMAENTTGQRVSGNPAGKYSEAPGAKAFKAGYIARPRLAARIGLGGGNILAQGLIGNQVGGMLGGPDSQLAPVLGTAAGVASGIATAPQAQRWGVRGLNALKQALRV